MTYDNYFSPYGFGPVTDAVIDCIADRRSMSTSEMEDHLGAVREAQQTRYDDGTYDEAEIDVKIEMGWWESHMGPAVDALEDLLFPPKDSAEAFREAGNADPFQRDSTGQAIGYVEGDPITTEF